MGGYSYSEEEARSFKSSRGPDPFEHTKKVASGHAAAAAHADLDPKFLNKAGIQIRECLDSPVHPESLGIAFGLDVTGSMSTIPRRILDKLPLFFTALLEKGFVPHPAIAFAAIGDANSDRAPLQVTQFESDIKGFEALSKVWLEGGGGGTVAESYELAMYFMAKYCKLDCFDKRGQKGFMFLIGDEFATTFKSEERGSPLTATSYNWELSKYHVEKIIGEKLEANIPFDVVLEMLREKFEVCWIYPQQASYFTGHPVIHQHWQKVFGEDYYELDNTDNFVEFVVGIIASRLGFSLTEIADGLAKAGASAATVASVTTALSTHVRATSSSLVAKTSGAELDASICAPVDE